MTVLLSGGAATLLAAITVIGASREIDTGLVAFAAIWWVLAAGYGFVLGRRAAANPPIAGLLAEARHATLLPELRPGRTLLNRVWPLLVFVAVAGIVGVFVPSVAAVGAGFAIVWPLAIRRQESAVAAIEERDAVRFYVDQTSPVEAIRLIRTPGFGGDFLAQTG
jgi:hypothetical protein